MNKIKLFLTLALSIPALSSCNELKSAMQLTACQYELGGISQPRLAGINLANITTIDQINPISLLGLTSSFSSKNLPMQATINIIAKNHGKIAATLQRFDWAIDLEHKEMINGTMSKIITVPANGISTIPLYIGVNLYDLFKNDTKDNLLNFALNLANAGTGSSKVSIRIRPNIQVGDQILPLQFITLSKSVYSK